MSISLESLVSSISIAFIGALIIRFEYSLVHDLYLSIEESRNRSDSFQEKIAS